MADRAYRPNALEYPLSPDQVDGLNATIEDIYNELRKLQAGHPLLSATHTDTEPAAEVDGDLISGQSGKWKRLPVGTNKKHLIVDGTNPAWGTDGSTLTDLNASNITTGTLNPARLADSGVTPGTYGDSTHVSQVTVDAKGRVTVAVAVAIDPATHSLLSTTHPDTEPASPTLGDLVVAQNSGALDVGKYFIDGQPFDYLPNANNPGAEAFWFDGLPAVGLISSGAVKWARKANGTPGYVLTAGATGPDWQPAASGAGDYAFVYRASDVSVTDLVQTEISLETVVSDAAGFWSGGSPTRFTVPSGKAGKYVVVAQASSEVPLNGTLYVSIKKNGTIVAEHSQATNAQRGPAQCNYLGELAAGDYVEMSVLFNTSSASKLIKGGQTSSFLQLLRVA